MKKANYEKQKALDLLHEESLKYCRAAIPTKKMSLHGNNLGSSMESQNDFSSRSMSSSSDDMQSLRNCPSTTETIPLPKPRVPPPIPQNAPIASSLPSPLYTSPVYRPDIDLSLPLNCVPERNQNARTVKMFCGNSASQGVAYPTIPSIPSPSQPKRASTSVNLVLQPTSEQVPFVSFTSASMDNQTGRHSQLKITISPQGGSASAMRSCATSGIGSMPTMSPNWHLGGSPTSVTSHSRNESSVSPPNVDRSGKTEWLTTQCEKREWMRLSLEESKSQLQKLRNKVENLQEEVTRKKHLQNRPFLLEPSVVAMVDFEKLRNEVRILQLDCQQMYQEIDDSTSESNENPSPAVAPTNLMICLNEEDSGWNCHICTFRNHPALNKCEECGIPRPLGPSNISSQIIRGSAFGGGISRSFGPFNRSNIHIHVSHRHVLSPPKHTIA